MEKHDELKVQLANCQKDEQSTRIEMEQELASALKDTLISKDEFTKKIAETQHDLLYGLESKVLDKVRNDPVIMERMTVLAHQTGQQFSKGTIHILRKHYYSSKLNLASKFLMITRFFSSNPKNFFFNLTF